MNSVLIPALFLKDEKLVSDFSNYNVLSDNPVDYSVSLAAKGANKIIIFDLSNTDSEHDKALTCIRNITRAVDIPIIGAGNIKRLEDVKKILYAGCKACALNMSKDSNLKLIEEASKRFEKDKIMVCIKEEGEYYSNEPIINEYSSAIVSINEMVTVDTNELTFIHIEKDPDRQVYSVNIDCKYKWSDLKKNSDGYVPVVVQDYKTDEVLMLADMNEEAYDTTITTGRMTYFSRSRQQLWIKGETSGHYQYVRSIEIDCDNDTLLAKVKQIGAACHTGNRSCFYRNLISTEYAETNPLKIFNKVMDIIEDRKLHPKEGSYTNYLFDKGIDKILKKCGEEATEIIIAAKNPDPEEIKYEISDFLYHVMVLMVLKDVTWDDIVKELANR